MFKLDENEKREISKNCIEDYESLKLTIKNYIYQNVENRKDARNVSQKALFLLNEKRSVILNNTKRVCAYATKAVKAMDYQDQKKLFEYKDIAINLLHDTENVINGCINKAFSNAGIKFNNDSPIKYTIPAIFNDEELEENLDEEEWDENNYGIPNPNKGNSYNENNTNSTYVEKEPNFIDLLLNNNYKIKKLRLESHTLSKKIDFIYKYLDKVFSKVDKQSLTELKSMLQEVAYLKTTIDNHIVETLDTLEEIVKQNEEIKELVLEKF